MPPKQKSERRRTTGFFPLGEAIGQILEDDENDVDNVVIIPPEPEGNISDEEEGEEGSSVPSDVPWANRGRSLSCRGEPRCTSQ